MRRQSVWRKASAIGLALFVSGCFEGADSGRKDNGLLQACERDSGAPPPAVNGSECGYIDVPLDYAEPEGAKVQLFVKRWPSISSVAEPDPVFVIAGGPGQSATEVSDRLSQAFFNLRKKRDIVFVDQYGTGMSEPLHCEGETSDSLTLLQSEIREQTIKKIKACAETVAEKAPRTLTYLAVEDLESVRKALGYAQVNLWGASYGTRVVIEYLRRFPESVRTAVADGLAPVQIALPYRMGITAKFALEKVSAQCEQVKECKQRYGNIEQTAEAVARSLQDSPVEITIEDPLTGQPRTLLLDAEKFAALVRLTLYDRLSSKVLPHLLASAANGDFTLLAKTVSQLMGEGGLANLAMGMHFSVVCSEDARVPNPPIAIPFLGQDLSDIMLEVCDFWPQGKVPDDFFKPVESSVPVLLLSGKRDPVTPPIWGEWVSEGLSQSTHVIAIGAHHGVTTEGCGATLVTGFIRNKMLSESELSCVDLIQPLVPYLAAEESQDKPSQSILLLDKETDTDDKAGQSEDVANTHKEGDL